MVARPPVPALFVQEINNVDKKSTKYLMFFILT
jgi:hypothetical protein